MKSQHIKSLLLMCLFLMIASLIGMVFHELNWADTNIILVYFLAVLMTARLTEGYVYGVLSSVIGTFLFNYFFTQPLYTLSVYDSKYFITFIFMTITASIMSASTTRIKRSTQIANENAQNMKTLNALTNHLSDALDYESLGKVVIRIFSVVFDCQVGCVCFADDLSKSVAFQGKKEDIEELKITDMIDYQAKFFHVSKSSIEINDNTHYSIYGIHKILGVLILPTSTVTQMSDMQKKLLTSMIENVSLAIDHIYAIQEQFRLKEATIKERYRSNLLRAISHDLRTPLTAIMGTSEMIMDMNHQESESYQLAKGIYDESSWLSLLVENILSLTKVQEGQLVIHKQVEAIEEVIGSAIYHITKNDHKENMRVHVPQDVLMVPMDAKLIQQVIINLLDNALKHTPKDCFIDIYVYQDEHYAYLSIEDYGQGFEKEDMDKLFEMFYTHNKTAMSDASKGVGLGLTICKAIIEAHGGFIKAENCQEHQGAKFTFALPL